MPAIGLVLIGTTFDSPVGTLTLGATEAGVRLVEFEGRVSIHVGEGTNPQLEQLQRELEEYFAGTRKTFTVALDVVGTEFQRRVWSRLCGIPYGQTLSYGELAQEVQSVARAVGSANGSNHVAIVIPCHRVIAADGQLHGYGGGLGAKRWLLDHESPQTGLF